MLLVSSSAIALKIFLAAVLSQVTTEPTDVDVPRLVYGTTQRLESEPPVCAIAQAKRARSIGPTLSPICSDSAAALLTFQYRHGKTTVCHDAAFLPTCVMTSR